MARPRSHASGASAPPIAAATRMPTLADERVGTDRARSLRVRLAGTVLGSIRAIVRLYRSNFTMSSKSRGRHT